MLRQLVILRIIPPLALLITGLVEGKINLVNKILEPVSALPQP
jgi:hypothetical protein